MLILLKDIRKNLLWLWLGFSIPILLLILVQTISGKLHGIEGTAWTWVGLNLIPVLLVLLIGAILNKNSSKVLQKFIFRIIWGFSLFYLLVLIFTLLGMNMGNSGRSLQTYLEHSYRWLLPFQGFLLLIFGLLFFRKHSIFTPNKKLIQSHLQTKAQKAQQEQNIPQQQAYEKIIANDYSELFDQLKSHFAQQSNMEDEERMVILQQSQYNTWQNKINQGIVDPKDAQIMLNRVTIALIDLIEKL